MLQSGLYENWWADFMECFTYLRNIQHLVWLEGTIGKALRNDFKRTSAAVWSNGRQFGAKVLQEYFSVTHCIRGENLERRHYGRRHGRIGGDGRTRNPRPKSQCNGSVNAKERWYFIFPIADGIVKLSGGHQVLRTSTFILDRRPRSTRKPSSRIRRIFFDTTRRLIRLWRWSQEWFLVHFCFFPDFIFPVEDGTVKTFGGDPRLKPSTLTRQRRELHSPTQLQDYSTRDDEEAEDDFWTVRREFIYRHHVESRVKLYVPKEELVPIPSKYIDVKPE